MRPASKMNSSNKCAEQVFQSAAEHSLRRSRRNTVAAPCFSRGRSALALRKYAALRQGALALGTDSGDFPATVSAQCQSECRAVTQATSRKSDRCGETQKRFSCF